jgi:hypothetical protein
MKTERKIVSISNEGYKIIKVVFSDNEFAVFSSFAKSIYTQTSPGVLKKTLSEFKKDIVKTGWNVVELKKLWINN